MGVKNSHRDIPDHVPCAVHISGMAFEFVWNDGDEHFHHVLSDCLSHGGENDMILRAAEKMLINPDEPDPCPECLPEFPDGGET